MYVKDMELFDRIDGTYFTHEIRNPVFISNINLDWMEEE